MNKKNKSLLQKLLERIADSYLYHNYPRQMNHIFSDVEEFYYEKDYDYDDENDCVMNGWIAKLRFGEDEPDHKNFYYVTIFLDERVFNKWIEGDMKLLPDWKEA